MKYDFVDSEEPIDVTDYVCVENRSGAKTFKIQILTLMLDPHLNKDELLGPLE